jgi:hypothetical protein
VCSVSVTVSAQGDPRAAANQLHAAIANGDVEALRYWLDVRQADASAGNAAEPGVTPLERCVGLAARTLDASRPPDGQAPIALRTLQDMVALLHARGARLTEAERSPFSTPVLRWYDDAVGTPAAPPPARPAPATQATERTGGPPIAFARATVLVSASPRESCNGGGHVVYLVNQTSLSVTATVTTREDAAGTTAGNQKSDSYAVDADTAWRLGCSVSADGRSVRYVLNDWR